MVKLDNGNEADFIVERVHVQCIVTKDTFWSQKLLDLVPSLPIAFCSFLFIWNKVLLKSDNNGNLEIKLFNITEKLDF